MAARTAARWLLTAGATVSAPALGWAALQEHPLRSLSLVSQAPVRLARDAAAAALTVVGALAARPGTARNSPPQIQPLIPSLHHRTPPSRCAPSCVRTRHFQHAPLWVVLPFPPTPPPLRYSSLRRAGGRATGPRAQSAQPAPAVRGTTGTLLLLRLSKGCRPASPGVS